MNLTIYPRKLSGQIRIIPSKSQAHRMLILAAFAPSETTLLCADTNQDIEATAACLRALGAAIERTEQGYHVEPATTIPKHAVLPCGESGSTLRFLVPVAAALGVDATFKLEGRLPQRPMSPLWEELERCGCILSRPTEDTIRCCGKLNRFDMHISGGISSQFITGLLLALSLTKQPGTLTVSDKLESRPYVDMTLDAMNLFGISVTEIPAENAVVRYQITGGSFCQTPQEFAVEGDWSNGAFFLAAKQLGCQLDIIGLLAESSQGDRTAAHLLPALDTFSYIDATDIPDLVPILAVTAGALQGAEFTGTARLRLKESDRIASTCALIRGLGGKAEETADGLRIYGTGYIGGTVDSFGDHRIAMAAAIASTVCSQPVTILGAQAVDKSYPRFWDEFRRLGGYYEFDLR